MEDSFSQRMSGRAIVKPVRFCDSEVKSNRKKSASDTSLHLSNEMKRKRLQAKSTSGASLNSSSCNESIESTIPEKKMKRKLAYKVERLPSPRSTVGEIPHWDAKTRNLYYIDINGFNSLLCRYDSDENRVYTATIAGAPTLLFLLPVECTENHFLVGIDRKAVIVQWDGRSPEATPLQTLFEVDCGTTNVLNDIKTDSRGRLYFGTKSVESCSTNKPATGAFYTYEEGKCLKKLFEDVYISNGLTWVRQTNQFYYCDSCAYDIKEFDYDPRTGGISNKNRIFSLVENGVEPSYIFDGMTSDRNGSLYAATFGGSKIMKIDPKARQVLLEIDLPATQITSLAFGGPNLNTLYVTTANKDGKQPAGSGYLYKVTGLNATGYAGVRVKVYPSCANRRVKYSNSCYPFCTKKY